MWLEQFDPAQPTHRDAYNNCPLTELFIRDNRFWICFDDFVHYFLRSGFFSVAEYWLETEKNNTLQNQHEKINAYIMEKIKL